MQDSFGDCTSASRADDRGKLSLGLMFEPGKAQRGITKGTLHVEIKNATSLPNMDVQGYTDGFVKMSLLPSTSRKKTHVINDDLNPVWNERFEFTNVKQNDLLTQRVLELTVWDHDKLSSNDFIGGLRLGPALNKPDSQQQQQKQQQPQCVDSNAEEARHWEEMLAHPGEWVERCHSLRASMSHRTGVNGRSPLIDRAPFADTTPFAGDGNPVIEETPISEKWKDDFLGVGDGIPFRHRVISYYSSSL